MNTAANMITVSLSSCDSVRSLVFCVFRCGPVVTWFSSPHLAAEESLPDSLSPIVTALASGELVCCNFSFLFHYSLTDTYHTVPKEPLATLYITLCRAQPLLPNLHLSLSAAFFCPKTAAC